MTPSEFVNKWTASQGGERATLATVTSVRASGSLAELEFLVVNQRGEEVLAGQATVFQAKPEPSESEP